VTSCSASSFSPFCSSSAIRSTSARASSRLGEYASDRPVHFQEIFATIYHNLGIDPATTTIADPTGRPQYLVEHPVMRELI